MPSVVWRRSKTRAITPRNNGNLSSIINTTTNTNMVSTTTTNSCNISSNISSTTTNSSNSSINSVSNTTAPPSSPSIIVDDNIATSAIASSALSTLLTSSSSNTISNNNNGSLTNVSSITNVSGMTTDSPTVLGGGGGREESDSSSKSPSQTMGASNSVGGGESSTAPSTPINQCGSQDESTSTPTGPCGSQDENSAPLGQGESQDGSSPTPTSPEVTVNGKAKNKKEKEATKKKGRSKEVVVHEPAVLIEGVLFRARYLGSTQLVSEGQPTKTTRMMQAEEAVTRIKETEDQQENLTSQSTSVSASPILTAESLQKATLEFASTPNACVTLPSATSSQLSNKPYILSSLSSESPNDPAKIFAKTEMHDKIDSPLKKSEENNLNEVQPFGNHCNDDANAGYVSEQHEFQDKDEEDKDNEEEDEKSHTDDEGTEESEEDLPEDKEQFEQYNPPKYAPVVYKPKGQYPHAHLPEVLNIQGDLTPGEEKQTLHERFSKLQDKHNKNTAVSSMPRLSHSPVKKHSSVPVEYLKPSKTSLGYDVESYALDSHFKTSHSWKTQAKMSTGNKSGSSVITVPCDGKANLLGGLSIPLKSPLPPGVLEEPISSTRPATKVDIHGQLLDFIEERNTASNSKLHKHLFNFLPEKKVRSFKEQSATSDELQMLTEPSSQADEDGVMLYEEDSNDGMDRKLQEFDDDIIEEEEEYEDDSGELRNGEGSHAMTEDAKNGNLADAIANAGRNELGRNDNMRHSSNDEMSTDDNDEFAEPDDNANGKTTKKTNRRDNADSDKEETAAETFSGGDAVDDQKSDKTRSSESRSRENLRQGSVGNVAWIVDGGGGIGATGTVFHLRLVGSVEVSEEKCDVSVGTKTVSTHATSSMGKRPRKEMVTEAVTKLKAPDGENQPNTEVDLFISTEKIMVLNTDLKEIMMDHALRTISYIADIGDLVVLMARRRMLPTDDPNSLQKQPKMICHVFESDEAQFIAQSIGQAFQVAYLEFLKANGIEDHSFVKEMDYQEVLNSQEIFGDELQMFAKKELQKEVVVPKMKSEILGVVVVESGWGSMVPTVVIANLSPYGAAAKCGQLNIGDQIIAINGVSLVGLPLSTCQNYIKNTKYNTAVKLTVVPCPPVVEVKIRRPDTKYQLGFSVQNGVICSLLRGGIAERGGVRVGHRIIDINSQSVVAVPHEKIVNLLATSVGEIRMKTMPTSIFRLLTGQETPQYI